MSVLLRGTVASLLVALLAAQPSSAVVQPDAAADGAGPPQQTAEGAHRFLALITEQQNIFAYPTRNSWPAFGAKYHVTMAQDGPCATRVDGKVAAYTFGQGWVLAGTPQFNAKRLAALHAQHRVAPPPYTIDWSRVASVAIVNGVVPDAQDNPGQVVLTDGANGFVQLFFADQTTAKRVRYAMEFLKLSCDKTAETGF